jgi:hypothetical protein
MDQDHASSALSPADRQGPRACSGSGSAPEADASLSHPQTAWPPAPSPSKVARGDAAAANDAGAARHLDQCTGTSAAPRSPPDVQQQEAPEGGNASPPSGGLASWLGPASSWLQVAARCVPTIISSSPPGGAAAPASGGVRCRPPSLEQMVVSLDALPVGRSGGAGASLDLLPLDEMDGGLLDGRLALCREAEGGGGEGLLAACSEDGEDAAVQHLQQGEAEEQGPASMPQQHEAEQQRQHAFDSRLEGVVKRAVAPSRLPTLSPKPPVPQSEGQRAAAKRVSASPAPASAAAAAAAAASGAALTPTKTTCIGVRLTRAQLLQQEQRRAAAARSGRGEGSRGSASASPMQSRRLTMPGATAAAPAPDGRRGRGLRTPATSTRPPAAVAAAASCRPGSAASQASASADRRADLELGSSHQLPCEDSTAPAPVVAQDMQQQEQQQVQQSEGADEAQPPRRLHESDPNVVLRFSDKWRSADAAAGRPLHPPRPSSAGAAEGGCARREGSRTPGAAAAPPSPFALAAAAAPAVKDSPKTPPGGVGYPSPLSDLTTGDPNTRYGDVTNSSGGARSPRDHHPDHPDHGSDDDDRVDAFDVPEAIICESGDVGVGGAGTEDGGSRGSSAEPSLRFPAARGGVGLSASINLGGLWGAARAAGSPGGRGRGGAAAESTAAMEATWALAATLDLEDRPIGSAALAGAVTPRRALDAAGGGAAAAAGEEGEEGRGAAPVVVVVERHRGAGTDGKLHTQVYRVDARRVEEDRRSQSVPSAPPGSGKSIYAQLTADGSPEPSPAGEAGNASTPSRRRRWADGDGRGGCQVEASDWDESDPFGNVAATAATPPSSTGPGNRVYAVRHNPAAAGPLDGESTTVSPEQQQKWARAGPRGQAPATAATGSPSASAHSAAAGAGPLHAFSPLRAMRSGGAAAGSPGMLDGLIPAPGSGYAPLSACLPSQHSQPSLGGGGGSSRPLSGRHYSRTAPRAAPPGAGAALADDEDQEGVQSIRKNLMREISEAGSRADARAQSPLLSQQPQQLHRQPSSYQHHHQQQGPLSAQASGYDAHLSPLQQAAARLQGPLSAASPGNHRGGRSAAASRRESDASRPGSPARRSPVPLGSGAAAAAPAAAGPLSRGTAFFKGASPASARGAAAAASPPVPLSRERPVSPYTGCSTPPPPLSGGASSACVNPQRPVSRAGPGSSPVQPDAARPAPHGQHQQHHPSRHRRARSDLPAHYPHSPLESPLHSLAPWEADGAADGAAGEVTDPAVASAAAPQNGGASSARGEQMSPPAGSNPLHRGLKSAAAQYRIAQARSPGAAARAASPAAGAAAAAGSPPPRAPREEAPCPAVVSSGAGGWAAAGAHQSGDTTEQAITEALEQVSPDLGLLSARLLISGTTIR